MADRIEKVIRKLLVLLASDKHDKNKIRALLSKAYAFREDARHNVGIFKELSEYEKVGKMNIELDRIDSVVQHVAAEVVATAEAIAESSSSDDEDEHMREILARLPPPEKRMSEFARDFWSYGDPSSTSIYTTSVGTTGSLTGYGTGYGTSYGTGYSSPYASLTGSSSSTTPSIAPSTGAKVTPKATPTVTPTVTPKASTGKKAKVKTKVKPLVSSTASSLSASSSASITSVLSASSSASTASTLSSSSSASTTSTLASSSSSPPPPPTPPPPSGKITDADIKGIKTLGKDAKRAIGAVVKDMFDNSGTVTDRKLVDAAYVACGKFVDDWHTIDINLDAEIAAGISTANALKQESDDLREELLPATEIGVITSNTAVTHGITKADYKIMAKHLNEFTDKERKECEPIVAKIRYVSQDIDTYSGFDSASSDTIKEAKKEADEHFRIYEKAQSQVNAVSVTGAKTTAGVVAWHYGFMLGVSTVATGHVALIQKLHHSISTELAAAVSHFAPEVARIDKLDKTAYNTLGAYVKSTLAETSTAGGGLANYGKIASDLRNKTRKEIDFGTDAKPAPLIAMLGQMTIDAWKANDGLADDCAEYDSFMLTFDTSDSPTEKQKAYDNIDKTVAGMSKLISDRDDKITKISDATWLVTTLTELMTASGKAFSGKGKNEIKDMNDEINKIIKLNDIDKAESAILALDAKRSYGMTIAPRVAMPADLVPLYTAFAKLSPPPPAKDTISNNVGKATAAVAAIGVAAISIVASYAIVKAVSDGMPKSADATNVSDIADALRDTNADNQNVIGYKIEADKYGKALPLVTKGDEFVEYVTKTILKLEEDSKDAQADAQGYSTGATLVEADEVKRANDRILAHNTHVAAEDAKAKKANSEAIAHQQGVAALLAKAQVDVGNVPKDVKGVMYCDTLISPAFKELGDISQRADAEKANADAESTKLNTAVTNAVTDAKAIADINTADDAIAAQLLTLSNTPDFSKATVDAAANAGNLLKRATGLGALLSELCELGNIRADIEKHSVNTPEGREVVRSITRVSNESDYATMISLIPQIKIARQNYSSAVPYRLAIHAANTAASGAAALETKMQSLETNIRQLLTDTINDNDETKKIDYSAMVTEYNQIKNSAAAIQQNIDAIDTSHLSSGETSKVKSVVSAADGSLANVAGLSVKFEKTVANIDNFNKIIDVFSRIDKSSTILMNYLKAEHKVLEDYASNCANYAAKMKQEHVDIVAKGIAAITVEIQAAANAELATANAVLLANPKDGDAKLNAAVAASAADPKEVAFRANNVMNGAQKTEVQAAKYSADITAALTPRIQVNKTADSDMTMVLNKVNFSWIDPDNVDVSKATDVETEMTDLRAAYNAKLASEKGAYDAEYAKIQQLIKGEQQKLSDFKKLYSGVNISDDLAKPAVAKNVNSAITSVLNTLAMFSEWSKLMNGPLRVIFDLIASSSDLSVTYVNRMHSMLGDAGKQILEANTNAKGSFKMLQIDTIDGGGAIESFSSHCMLISVFNYLLCTSNPLTPPNIAQMRTACGITESLWPSNQDYNEEDPDRVEALNKVKLHYGIKIVVCSAVITNGRLAISPSYHNPMPDTAYMLSTRDGKIGHFRLIRTKGLKAVNGIIGHEETTLVAIKHVLVVPGAITLGKAIADIDKAVDVKPDDNIPAVFGAREKSRIHGIRKYQMAKLGGMLTARPTRQAVEEFVFSFCDLADEYARLMVDKTPNGDKWIIDSLMPKAKEWVDKAEKEMSSPDFAKFKAKWDSLKKIEGTYMNRQS